MKRPWYIRLLVCLLIDITFIISILNVDYWYIKLLACLLFGVGIAMHIWIADKRESGQPSIIKQTSRFAPYIDAWALPLFIVLTPAILLLSEGLPATIAAVFPLFTLIFLHISVYNAVLLLLLPLLRKHFSARVCAALWVFPNFLYFAYNPLLRKDQPMLIIPISGTIGYFPVLIWGIGFIATLLYQFTNHLLFKRKLLKNARRAWDMNVQRIWYDVLSNGAFQWREYPIMVSPDVSAPLSIGFFKKTTFVILPQKEYTEAEIRLILTHEAVHIGRKDSFTKLFMVFCAAICWFNPLAWIAVRHCSADMELSCDETVLLKESQETKQLYAKLLLKTAGNDRGFSTCLSTSAKTMLYRLTNTLKPQKRSLGAVAAGIAMFLLLSTCGLVSISYNPVGGEYLFNTIENASWGNNIVYRINENRYEYEYSDISVLHEYVSDIEFYQLTGTYNYPNDNILIAFYYQKTDYKNDYASTGVISSGTVELVLKDHTLTVIDFAVGGEPEIKTYYHNANIDWDYLLSSATPMS